ncbi:copper resistance protein CopC [Pokkaliibacter sp. MBI-7]|uniref:copper resistance CopC family protein n=1 Tax=Pokkaliibacter sp. MBI-7 TaxID=3040600 RepID=UPI00244A0DD5|nr:copper resistance protein CopC [Pokkaliibacter sp. MBI-7]MDH2434027.1 copper resistance protein CopC [Pokkaliibacter sp. MBI-7]
MQRLSRILTLVLAMLSAGLTLSAQAHMAIQSTEPADKQVLSASPGHITLTFPMAVTLTKVTVQPAGGEAITLPVQRVAEAVHTIATPALPQGTYAVKWICLGHDGHKMSGEFGFVVKP